LNVSIKTVEKHLSDIYCRLGVDCCAALRRSLVRETAEPKSAVPYYQRCRADASIDLVGAIGWHA
jgi:DNA-binding NarL/FixJ family response regulator